METTTKIKAGGFINDETGTVSQFYYSIVIENQNNAPMPQGMAAEIAEMEQRIIELLKGTPNESNLESYFGTAKEQLDNLTIR